MVKTILQYSSQALLKNTLIKQVVFALHPQDVHFAKLEFSNAHKMHSVAGGNTRAHSVLNALEAIKSDINPDDFVLVHDAARPCLSSIDLQKLIDACISHSVGGILAAPVTDTIKLVESNEIINTLDRNKIWRAFTPQMFKFKILYTAIKQALATHIAITDEASAIEHAGYQPCVVEGSSTNIKVTKPEDIALAKMYLTQAN